MDNQKPAKPTEAETHDSHHDFVELGTCSEDTKGGFTGFMYDGGAGRWSF